MRTYGLIGSTLTHSFSQGHFTKKFKALRLNAEYRNFELSHIGHITGVLELTPNLSGLNVTLPYKEAIIPYLHDLDSTAADIAAVNTVAFADEGPVGYNTDVIGFRVALDKLLAGERPPVAYVLGTGGAAKAVCWVLAQAELPYQVVSRSPSLSQIGYRAIDHSIPEGSLIVNCTPAGTYPHIDDMPPVKRSALQRAGFVLDLIYNPERSLLLQRAAAQGCRTLNGLPMLIGQAEASWKIWQTHSPLLND